MKEDMFEVLMYLFENHMQSDCKLHLTEDLLMAELEKVGFNSATIDKALNWLEGLITVQEHIDIGSTSNSHRIYNYSEIHRLNSEIRGFLLFLEEQMNILNTVTRELVIDRLMAIEDQEIGLHHVKWVILLVLFNQPNEEVALARMETLILENIAYGLN
jgi:Smg protein